MKKDTNKTRPPESSKPPLFIDSVSGSTFSIEELHALHSGLIAAKPHLNERTKGYNTTLKLIKKLSSMIGEYYR